MRRTPILSIDAPTQLYRSNLTEKNLILFALDYRSQPQPSKDVNSKFFKKPSQSVNH